MEFDLSLAEIDPHGVLPEHTHMDVQMNGERQIVIHLWNRDLSKPKCWREGNEYKFNSELVDSIYVEKDMIREMFGVNMT